MSKIRNHLTPRRLLLVCVSVFLLYVGYRLAAYPRGMLMAHFDCARGRYEIERSGMPAQWQFISWRIIHDKYGVDVNHGGCVVTPDSLWYEDGYNSVSEPRIRARFGKNVIAECDRVAEIAMQQVPRYPLFLPH